MDDWQSDEGHEVLHDQDDDRKSRVEAVLAALDEFKPEGRLALGLDYDSKVLPPILMEMGDRVLVPPMPN